MRTPATRRASFFRRTPLIAALACAFVAPSAFGVVYMVTTTSDSGPGSLRQAIFDANANCFPDPNPGIEFNIPSAPFVIAPSSPLPAFACSSNAFYPTVNGRSQPGASVNTLSTGWDAVIPIVIDGTSSGAFSGLSLCDCSGYGGRLFVEGLEIRNFTYGGNATALYGNLDLRGNVITNNSYGVTVTGGSIGGGPADRNLIENNTYTGIDVGYAGTVTIRDNYVRGNNIGIDWYANSNGTIASNLISGNAYVGMWVYQDNNTTVQGNKIGLTEDATASDGNQYGLFVESSTGTVLQNNIVSGNDYEGVSVSYSSGVQILSNKLGTNALVDTALPNSQGLSLYCVDSAHIQNNIISGNVFDGIYAGGLSATNIWSNKIGVREDGVTPMGNGSGMGVGLDMGDCSPSIYSINNYLYGNTIANSGLDGVYVVGDGSVGNKITESTIYANGRKNINLDFLGGPLPNDAGDADTGPNNRQNYPIISSVAHVGGNTEISWSLNSLASTNFQIDFYANPAAGAPAGQTYLQNNNFTTDGSGNFSTTTVISGTYDNISLQAMNDAANDSSEFSPIVSVTASPAVSITPTSLDFGSISVGASSASRSSTVTSTGTAPFVITTFDSSPSCYGGPFCYGGDFSCSTTCVTDTSYGSGASCTVSGTFHPSFAGSQTTTIYLCDNASGSPHSITLTGNGVAPAPLAINPADFDFGSVLVGARSASQRFVISNSSDVAADIGPPSTSGDFALDSTNCTAQVPPHASCDAEVSFVPTQAGFTSGTLFVPTGGAKSAGVSANLYGTGVQNAQLTMPDTVNVGTMALGGAPLTVAVELRNSGNAVLTISSITVSAPFTLTNNCPLNLAPGASCNVIIGFNGTAVGDFNGTLSVVTNASGGSRSIPVTARVQAQATPVVRVTPTFIGFGARMLGTQGESQRITVRNEGGVEATLSAPTLSVEFVLAGTSCGPTLAPSSTCFADVAFRPLGFGPRPGLFSIGSNSAGSPHTVDLVGTGCRPFSMAARGGAASACAP